MKESNLKNHIETAIILLMLASIFLIIPYNGIDNDAQINTNVNMQANLSQTNHPAIIIESDTDFESQGFPGSGTYQDPYRIEGFTISTSEICINITSTNSYFIIKDCILKGSNIGIGIHLKNVSHGTLMNNTIRNKTVGIQAESVYNMTIANNTIYHNVQDGVTLISGILINITGNIVFQNGRNGILIYQDSRNNTLTWNFVHSNDAYGIVFEQYNNYSLLHSNILAASYAGIAMDNGYCNSWNISDEGNFWIDYSGVGWRIINGNAGSIDYHPQLLPLSYDIFPPTIDHPLDLLTYTPNATGTIIWHAYDTYPKEYVLVIDGVQLPSQSWNGGPISAGFDNLYEGLYNFTLIVYDQADNWVSDTVWVYVTQKALPPPPSTTTTNRIPQGGNAIQQFQIIITAVSGGLVLTIVLIEIHKRRK